MNPWLILGFVLAVAAASGAGLYQGHELGMAEVQQKWDKERAAQEAEYAAAQAAAREKEQSLQASADHLRQEKDREIRDLNARAVALSNSLRDRPTRPAAEASAVSSTTEVRPVATGCTGEKLYRPDGEFLAREAARGDEARLLLKQCREQYETVIQMLMETK
jgi:hypothetical protein